MFNPISSFVTPAGRLGRQRFLPAVLGLTAVNIIVAQLPIVGDILAFLLLWPLWCITAQRLHDVGRSALFAAVVTLCCGITGTLAIMADLIVPGEDNAIAALAMYGVVTITGAISVVLAMILLMWAAAMPGNSGANRFSEPYRAPQTVTGPRAAV